MGINGNNRSKGKLGMVGMHRNIKQKSGIYGKMWELIILYIQREVYGVTRPTFGHLGNNYS